MEKTNFWNDAAFYGVIMALLAIVFDTLNFYTQHALLSLVSLLLYVTLLTVFTKQRVARYGAAGYSYGQCLWFIVATVLCAGFIDGAYLSVAANWLFAERYEAMMAPQVALLESTGFYNDDQIALLNRMLYSPLALIFSAIVGAVFKGGFFGLFISAYARRERSPFGPNGHFEVRGVDDDEARRGIRSDSDTPDSGSEASGDNGNSQSDNSKNA